ncbi:putative manganese-dependent inorganic diphosphatase [Miltoncostaea marina]|uniref:putative manganese-dependent inorganic diphosphatase n=1 Tax=Miltoncostaea marina TaxID=2843215 RepID=UPI001C3CBC37|nr:putative manganese-dependent inorganic diphosphatase [Miltoncostaea marina]
MQTIYVTGHRNPDLDSIASAMGYAELKGRLDPANRYVPVRLGEINAQARWALERSGAPAPELLDHVMLRARDVMRHDYPRAEDACPLRDVGRTMAANDLDLIPIVDGDEAIVGILTARDLARRYVKESGEPSSFADRPASVELIVEVLGGRLLVPPQRRLNGRLWAVTVDAETMGSTMGPNDIAVIGNRTDAQRKAVEIGVALLVAPYDVEPDAEVLAEAEAAGTGVVVSPLDSYVTGRLVSLSVPVREVMTRDPLVVDPDDLLTDVAERIKGVHYSAAIVADDDGRPMGVVTRAELVNPEPRHVLLVDHAEEAQSAPGVGEAHIVEILDHHHIGSIETRFPVTAVFDPVGSTATLVVERFRSHGREPRQPTAAMLLAAILSDTVILSSPTTTDRDREVVEYLEELLRIDARSYGTEMFEASSDVGDVPASEIIRRDAKEYEVSGGRRLCVAQIETVGRGLLTRKDELLGAMELVRDREDYAVYALMVTDIVEKGTELLVAGDAAAVARAFGLEPNGSVLDLPGVMSRKKQVAPKLLAAF